MILMEVVRLKKGALTRIEIHSYKLRSKRKTRFLEVGQHLG